MNKEQENKLKNYYEIIDEDKRLIKDKSHSIEFITTIKYIEKYLSPNSKILEIGAGTGRYSIYFAEKGYDVTAIELLDVNINKLKNKISNNMKITAIKANALDLSFFEDDSFDIVLLFGALYHLFTNDDKEKAINEAIRVTKTGGKIFMAYITNDTVILSECLRKNNMSKIEEYCDIKNNYKAKEKINNVFSVNYVKDFETMLVKFPVSILKQVAADGIAPNMQYYINKLNDKDFKKWLDYHFATCEREDLLSYSSHILCICQKNKEYNLYDKNYNYFNNRFLYLKKYLSQSDIKNIEKFGIKLINRPYTAFEFEKIFYRIYEYYFYKNNQEKYKNLENINISRNEYNKLFDKLLKINNKFNLGL